MKVELLSSTNLNVADLAISKCYDSKFDDKVDNRSLEALVKLQELVKMGVPNDEAKYAMPEAYKTSLVWSINARSLQNFLKLRLGRTVLEEMYSLAMKIAMEIPEDHRFLYEDIVKEVFEGERKWMKTIS